MHGLQVVAGAILAPALLGFGLLRALGVPAETERRCVLALAYLVGHFVMAHVIYVWLVLGQPVPGWSLSLFAAAAGVLLLRGRPRGVATGPRAATSPLVWVPLLVLCLLFLDAFFTTNVDPIRRSDEAEIWASKAKVLFATPGFDIRHPLHFFVQHPDYPLLDPLVQVLSFANAGAVLHHENRLPIQMFALALLALLSAALSRRAHGLIGNLALVAFAGSSFAFQAPTAYADTMLACATLACVDCLLRWRESGNAAWWRVGCIAMAAMLATKNEGAMLAVVVVFVFTCDQVITRVRRPRLKDLAWLLVPGSTFVLGSAFNRYYDLRNDLLDPAAGGGKGLLERVVGQVPTHAQPVAEHYGGMLIDANLHRLLPLALCAAVLLHALPIWRRQVAAGAVLPAATFALATLGYMTVFVGTHSDVHWHLGTAADRTLQHVLPLAVLGLCALVWPRPTIHSKPPSTPIT